MVAGNPSPGFIRRFLSRVRQFLTPRQRKIVRREIQQPPNQQPPTQQPAQAPTPPRGAPVAATSATRTPTTTAAPTASPEQIRAQQLRIAELRRLEEDARRERERLETKVAAQEPPIRALGDFERREGFEYSTWFKAFGTFGTLRELGDSPQLLGEMEELEEFDVPSAFYSSSLIGQVKFPDVVPLAGVMGKLNAAAPWQGEDFREIYPQWDYRYYVAEMVGDVVVQIFEHKARQPITGKDRGNGYVGR